MKQGAHCIVIGGGMAGIAAAMTLADNGLRVALYEGRPYLGGRMRSFRDRHTGDIIDNGQHLLMGAYRHTLNLLARLGTDSLLHSQSKMRVDFVDPDGSVARFAAPVAGKIGTALALLRLGGLGLRDKLHALRMALRVQMGGIETRNMSALDFLRSNGQSAQCIERFWEPLVLATLNAPVHTAAATLLLAVLQQALFADAASARLIFPASGLSDLLAPVPAYLAARGGRVYCSANVATLEISAGRATGVVLADGRPIRSDTIICAVPPRVLERLVPSEHPQPLLAPHCTDFSYSPIISVYLWFDRDFFAGDFAAMLGSTTQWVFNRRRLCGCDEEVARRYPGHLALTISAAAGIADAGAEEIRELCLQELHNAFPAARDARLLHYKVIKEKTATFLSSPAAEHLRPGPHTPYPNVFLAGDWTDTGLPATIEGAAQSGVAAARALLNNPPV